MGLKKLREKVNKQQEKVEEKMQTVANNRNMWVENVDRMVAGFLEIFEEGCHKMGTAIRDRIQEQLMANANAKRLAYDDEDYDDDEEYYYDASTDEEYDDEDDNGEE